MISERRALRDLLMEVYEMSEEEADYAIEEFDKKHISSNNDDVCQ